MTIFHDWIKSCLSQYLKKKKKTTCRIDYKIRITIQTIVLHLSRAFVEEGRKKTCGLWIKKIHTKMSFYFKVFYRRHKFTIETALTLACKYPNPLCKFNSICYELQILWCQMLESNLWQQRCPQLNVWWLEMVPLVKPAFWFHLQTSSHQNRQ